MPRIPEDPVLVSARREAWIVFACWLTAMTWSVSYCYLNGYISLVSPTPVSALVAADEQVDEKELKARVKKDQIKADQTNAARISSKQLVEVRPPTTEGGVPALWIDRGQGKERVDFVLGFPAWVFWGCALPWWLCTAFSLFFGAFIVRDEDLGLDPDAAIAAEGEVTNV